MPSGPVILPTHRVRSASSAGKAEIPGEVDICSSEMISLRRCSRLSLPQPPMGDETHHQSHELRCQSGQILVSLRCFVDQMWWVGSPLGDRPV